MKMKRTLRVLMPTTSLAVLGCLSMEPDDQSLSRIDRQFPGPALQSVRPPLPGKLTADGEGVCRELPYSACQYEDKSGFRFYFNEGALVSKQVRLSQLGPGASAPFGIVQGDSVDKVRRKLRQVTRKPAQCLLASRPYACFVTLGENTRVDVSFGSDLTAEEIRLYVTDYV